MKGEEQILHNRIDSIWKEVLKQENTMLTHRLNIIKKKATASLNIFADRVCIQLYPKMEKWMLDRLDGETEATKTLAHLIKTKIEEELPLHFSHRLTGEDCWVDEDRVIKPILQRPPTSIFDDIADPAHATRWLPAQLLQLAKHFESASTSQGLIRTHDLYSSTCICPPLRQLSFFNAC